MRLIADENVETAIVAWLRAQDHDVAWIAESAPSLPDHEVLSLAASESRILITADLDFGEMVVRQRLVSPGIILLRFRSQTEQERWHSFRMQWPFMESRAAGHLVIVSDDRFRVRKLL